MDDPNACDCDGRTPAGGDARYGIPLGFVILPANRSDSPQLLPLVDKLKETHPDLPVRYMSADRGYDGMSNYQGLVDREIRPVIQIRDTDKGGIYTLEGRPTCIGGKPMEYIGTDTGEADQGHLFRCPPEGCRLKDRIAYSRFCDSEHFEKPEGDLLRRVGLLPRAGRLWPRLYKLRTTIERMFGSMKASRLLNTHRYQNIRNGAAARYALKRDLPGDHAVPRRDRRHGSTTTDASAAVRPSRPGGCAVGRMTLPGRWTACYKGPTPVRCEMQPTDGTVRHFNPNDVCPPGSSQHRFG